MQEYKPQIRNTLFNPLSWTHFPEFSNHKFYCMTEGKDSAIWFGTANGVVYYNGIKWRHYTTADGIIEGRIKSLLTAKDGSIYAASNEGLCRYVDTGWVKIDLPFKPVNPYTSFNMYETNDGGLWVPSEVGVLKLINDSVLVYKHDGVYIIKGKQISLPDDKGFPEDKWYDIEDSLVKYRLNRDKFDVCGICEDDNNNLYFGGLSKRTVATVSTKKITPIRYLHRDDEVQLQDTEYLLRLLHTNDNKLVVISENSLTPVKIYDLNNGNLKAELLAQVADVNKPEAIKEKMVTGRLNKFYRQTCLLEQPFLKEDSLTVAEWLMARSDEVGTAVTVSDFIRSAIDS